MREPIATAPALTVATSAVAGPTMFGISNAQLVQHSFNGLPPLKADSPMSSGGILRPVSRASSIGGGGTLSSLKSSSGSGASSPAASVKRNSSSSSFGSSSDRRSVFYTDPVPDSDQSSRIHVWPAHCDEDDKVRNSCSFGEAAWLQWCATFVAYRYRVRSPTRDMSGSSTPYVTPGGLGIVCLDATGSTRR
uniref:Uncharacterized protein n=1 Tax=Anopheles atroparvus TaxID=41427 RepID=A0A182JAI3_ANOAO